MMISSNKISVAKNGVGFSSAVDGEEDIQTTINRLSAMGDIRVAFRDREKSTGFDSNGIKANVSPDGSVTYCPYWWDSPGFPPHLGSLRQFDDFASFLSAIEKAGVSNITQWTGQGLPKR